MVVTDNFLFPSSAMMKVRVTNMNGVDSIVEVGKDWTCDKVSLPSKCFFFFFFLRIYLNIFAFSIKEAHDCSKQCFVCVCVCVIL